MIFYWRVYLENLPGFIQGGILKSFSKDPLVNTISQLSYSYQYLYKFLQINMHCLFAPSILNNNS